LNILVKPLKNIIMTKYSKSASAKVEKVMKEKNAGTLTSRKQAIAIGLSEARKEGAKVPKKGY
jgi:hypothetical protein